MRSISCFGFICSTNRDIKPADVRGLQDSLTNAVFTGDLSERNQPCIVGGYEWTISRASMAEPPMAADDAEWNAA